MAEKRNKGILATLKRFWHHLKLTKEAREYHDTQSRANALCQAINEDLRRLGKL